MLPFTITILCEAPETETNSVTGDTMPRPARSTKRPRMIQGRGPIVVQFQRAIRSLTLPSNLSVTLWHKQTPLSNSLPFVRPDLPPGVLAALLDVTTVVPAPTGMSKRGVRTSIGTLEGSACVIGAGGA